MGSDLEVMERGGCGIYGWSVTAAREIGPTPDLRIPDLL